MSANHRLGISLILTLLVFIGAARGQSPMFRGDSRHSGICRGPFPEKAPKLLWRFQTGGKVLSSPAVTDGRLYIGSDNGRLYALNAMTGEKLWSFQTNGAVHSSPAVDQGAVYFSSRDGMIYALDAVSRRERWYEAKGLHGTHPIIQTIPDPWDCYLSSPLVSGNTVFCGSGDGHLYALEARTGRLKWKEDHKGTWVNVTPAVRNGLIYYGTSEPALLIAREAATGKPVLQQKMKGMIFSSPTIAENGILTGTFAGTLSGHDAATGAPLWEFRTEAHIRDESKILDPSGALNLSALFPDGPFNGITYFETMYSVMDKLWSVGAILSSPVLEKGVIYFGSADGYIYALQ